MVIFTAKLTKGKLIAILCAAAALLILVIFLANRSGSGATDGATLPASAAGEKLASNESRVALLASYGWEAAEEPVKTQEVKIPKTFTEVYEQYNALQQMQGFDLTKYRGKRVMQYVYQVTNYPGGGEAVFATLLLYKNKLIGGDLSRSGADGFLTGLRSNQ